MTKKHVFLAYPRENSEEVRTLRDDLIAAGESVWWDGDILGGQDDRLVIRQAMEAAYAVVLCLSNETQGQDASMYPFEIDYAIELYRKYPPGSVYLIPVRLSKCDVPTLEIGANRFLDRLKCVDLFPDSNRGHSVQNLVDAIRTTPEHPSTEDTSVDDARATSGTGKRSALAFHFEGDVDSFKSAPFVQDVTNLLEKYGIRTEVLVVDIRKGSVVLILEMSDEAAECLLSIAKSGHLSDLGVTHVADVSSNLNVSSDLDVSINFYEEFDEGAVNHGLRALNSALGQQGQVCYCLRLDTDIDAHGHFSRFGDIVLASDDAPKPNLSPELSIPLDLLVIDNWKWPPLAIREGTPPLASYGNPEESDLQEFLNRISWQVQVRLQQEEEYIGYFVAVGLDRSPPPTDHDLIAAAYDAKLQVASLLSYRRLKKTQTSGEFKARLRTTQQAIESLQDMERDRGLQHVGDMLTSHLGAGWNRAACYCPTDDNTLECLWAQGGDGRQPWCNDVQRPIGEGVRQAEGLVYLAGRRVDPGIDPYYAAAVLRGPLKIENIRDENNNNVLARLWRSNGNVAALPSHYREWECPPPLDPHMTSVSRAELSSGSNVAVAFDAQDPWVKQVNCERPGEPIFISQNGKYWAFPWRAHAELIGIWVLDMAYWPKLEPCSELPSLTFTEVILSSLGPSMHRYSQGHWQRQ